MTIGTHAFHQQWNGGGVAQHPDTLNFLTAFLGIVINKGDRLIHPGSGPVQIPDHQFSGCPGAYNQNMM